MKKHIFKLILISLIGLLQAGDRIITIGGCITETVFKLGQGNAVIAVDLSSTIPSNVKELPQVGYIRAISTEGILSLMPDKIITTTDIGPPNVAKQLKESGIDLHILESPHTIEEIKILINDIAEILDAKKQSIKTIKEIKKIDQKIKKIKSNYSTNPKIVFFMNPSKNSYSAAGSKTRADYLINYMGGINIFSKEFEKYKKVTKEEIISQNPEIILIASLQGKNSSHLFLQDTSLQSISAVKNNFIFNIDMGELLSFGPSFASNVLSLINSIDVK